MSIYPHTGSRKKNAQRGQPHTYRYLSLEKESTFWEHVEVLRWSIARCVGVVLLFFAAAFAVMPRIFDTYILGAASSDFFIFNLPGLSMGTFPPLEIININLATQFLTHISTSFWLAVTVAFPYIMFEAWRFISPALYSNERRSTLFAFTFGTAMFYTGCAVGYCVVFPVTLNFLARYQLSATVSNSISLDSYMSTFLLIIFIMGIMFELPLLIWLLSRSGIVNKKALTKYRRHAIVALMVLAAIITPTGDPFTLMVVFIPLYALYELGILMARRT